MLRLIPALLLLILNGPANAETPTQAAQWSAAFRALHSCVRQTAIASSTEQELLSCSNSAQLNQALLALLMHCADREQSPTPAIEPRAMFAPILTQSNVRPTEGFTACQRSRDGPISR